MNKNCFQAKNSNHYLTFIGWNNKKMSQRLDRYDQKGYAVKQRKLHENLNIAEKVLILAKRIKKISSLEI